MKNIAVGLVAMLGVFLVAAPVFAEVSVQPSLARLGAHQSFTLGVTSEKGLATTMVRLVIPEGVSGVKPNVKSGWGTSIEAHGGQVMELVWTGGIIPANHRDDFVFSAVLPNSPMVLPWMVYQSYEDGSVISWNMDPRSIPAGFLGAEQAAAGPYPVTRVARDLSASASGQLDLWDDPQITFFLALLALVLSLMNFGIHHNHLGQPLRRSRKA